MNSASYHLNPLFQLRFFSDVQNCFKALNPQKVIHKREKSEMENDIKRNSIKPGECFDLG